MPHGHTYSSSFALAPGCCLRHILDHPKSQQPRFKNGRKLAVGFVDVLDVPQLLLHLATISAMLRKTPGHNSPRFKNSSKSTASCLAVSAISFITPSHNSPRFKNGRKSTDSFVDVLDVPQLLLHLAAVSAKCWMTPGHNIPG